MKRPTLRHAGPAAVLAAILLMISLCAPVARAQSRPEKGSHELQLWTGGGHSVPGGTSNTGVFNVGARYGWILTGPHGPGFLRGNIEYAAEVVPLFLVFQPAQKVYGFGIDPLILKWNFEGGEKIAPYLELAGGPLFTNKQVPAGTSRVNFTSGAALGFYFYGRTITPSLEVRYVHISNAGLATPNPGINTVQVRVGFSWFTGGRSGSRKKSRP
jgi:lipid A 3-O-deacylase